MTTPTREDIMKFIEEKNNSDSINSCNSSSNFNSSEGSAFSSSDPEKTLGAIYEPRGLDLLDLDEKQFLFGGCSIKDCKHVVTIIYLPEGENKICRYYGKLKGSICKLKISVKG